MIIQTRCTSFLVELLQAIHDFTPVTGDTFKIALYTSSANLGADTTVYTATGEVANGNGYTTGGEVLVTVTPAASSNIAYTNFQDVTWAAASFTASGALIYNSSKANRAVLVLSFGNDKTANNQSFTVTFPASDATNAVLRIR